MRKIEKVAINEEEQKLYNAFAVLVREVEDNLADDCGLSEKFDAFLEVFEEVTVDEW